MTDLDQFHRLKARLKRGETLSHEERGLYRSLGRSWIALWKTFPRTPDVERSIKAVQQDMGLADRHRMKMRPKPTDPMREVLG